ncbi:hypothetical protein ACFY3N_35070 [Streptomyces sp. NPDC000348]|uniref:hypothetical protein n=1 Tax=Streptomyces sp. NPDC000348 TaxID=3364538 RepID=UPI00369AC58F
MSITGTGITLRTSVGLFVLRLDAAPRYSSLPTLKETDPLPVACYAVARCSRQDTTVVGHAPASWARKWGHLTVHAYGGNTGPRKAR